MNLEAKHHHDGLALACGLDPECIVFAPVAVELLEQAVPTEPCRIEAIRTEGGLANIIVTLLDCKPVKR